MRIRFYIDPAMDVPHIYAHGIDEHEVEDVLARPVEDGPAKLGSRAAIGRTKSGRLLRVIYVPDPVPGSVFVITAYALDGRQLQAFKRRQRRRRKK